MPHVKTKIEENFVYLAVNKILIGKKISTNTITFELTILFHFS